MNFISTAEAAEGAVPQQGQADWSMLIIMVVIFIAMMYFVTIRPNKKAMQQKAELLSKITVGDEVMLRSGMCGVVDEFRADGDYVVVKISDSTPVTFSKDAIVHILPKGTIKAVK